MGGSLGGVGFGFLAGLFSTLSPCVLPLLPLVVGRPFMAPGGWWGCCSGGKVASAVRGRSGMAHTRVG